MEKDAGAGPSTPALERFHLLAAHALPKEVDPQTVRSIAFRHTATGLYLAKSTERVGPPEAPGAYCHLVLAARPDDVYARWEVHGAGCNVYRIAHSTGGLLAGLPSKPFDSYTLPVVCAAMPPDAASRWSFQAAPDSAAEDMLHRGRIKIYDTPTGSGFIECAETHALYSRDVYFRVSAEEAAHHLGQGFLNAVVDFQAARDHLGRPKAFNMALALPRHADQWQAARAAARRLQQVHREAAGSPVRVLHALLMDTNDVLSSALGNSTRATLQDTLARVEYEASSEADREKEEETIIHPHEVTDFMPEVDDNETLLDDWNPDDPQNPFARQEAPQEEVEEMSAMLQSFNGELPDFRLPTGALLILPESGPISVASAGSVQLTLSSDGITRGVSVSALTESVQPHCFDVGKAEGSPGQGDALQQYIEQETCLEGIVSSEQVSKLSRLNRLRGSHDGVPFTVLLPNGRIELQMQPYTQDLLTLKVIEAKIAAQVESPHPAVSLQSASAPGYSSRGSSYTPLGATISVVTNHLGVGTLEGLLHVHVIKRPLWVISIMSSDFPPCITAALDRCAAKHLYLDAQDGPNTLLSVVLADCVRFFLDAHACGAFVYVHCVAGVNRSVTVGTALLMLCYRLGLKEASSLLHCLRDTSVLLNQQFCMELAALDHGLAAGWHCEALSD